MNRKVMICILIAAAALAGAIIFGVLGAAFAAVAEVFAVKLIKSRKARNAETQETDTDSILAGTNSASG